MSNRTADDFDEIGKHLEAIRRQERFVREHICAIQNGGMVAECWCYKAGEGGANLPCPRPDAPAAYTPGDPVKETEEFYEGCGFIITQIEREIEILKKKGLIPEGRVQIVLPWRNP